MSETFNAAALALANDPDLRAKVLSAGSADERAQIMRDAGITIPTHADVNSGLGNLAGVAGGGVTTSAMCAVAPSAASAAGAGC